MLKLLKTAIFTSAFAMIALSGTVYASEISIHSNESIEGIGQTQELVVFLKTQGQIINALEGKITIPNLIRINEIRYGDSLINNWIIKPTAGLEIQFAGIIPGGYNGEGKLFSMIMETRKSGFDEIRIEGAQVLLNDGKGTPDAIETVNYELEIPASVSDKKVEAISDETPPLDFEPLIVEDSKIKDGKKVLVFNTRDKQSGIDYYEVKEGNGDFIKSESPYVLNNQKELERLIVRAVDKSGNVREIEYKETTNNNVLYIIILIASIIGIFFILYIRRF